MKNDIADRNISAEENLMKVRGQVIEEIAIKSLQRDNNGRNTSRVVRLLAASATTTFWCGIGLLIGGIIVHFVGDSSLSQDTTENALCIMALCLIAVGIIWTIIRADELKKAEIIRRTLMNAEVHKLKMILVTIDNGLGIPISRSMNDINIGIAQKQIQLSNESNIKNKDR